MPGLPPVKIERLHGIARAALDGDLDAGRLRAMETAQALVELQRIPGIGLFSAELILIRGAGHPDVFPASERRLHDEMAHEYGLHDPSPARLAAIAEAGGPTGRGWGCCCAPGASWRRPRSPGAAASPADALPYGDMPEAEGRRDGRHGLRDRRGDLLGDHTGSYMFGSGPSDPTSTYR